MSTDSAIDKLPVGAGAAAGIGAYLLGYLLTYVWQSGSIEERLSAYNFIAELFGGEPIAVWQGIGWLFYNAHFVATRIDGFGGTQSQNFIAGSDGGAITLLYAVPIVLLLAAGLLTARLADADEPGDGAIAGAAVAVGYFPLALIGRFLFSYQGSAAPDLITAVLLAGLVYPLLFGAVGGVLGSAFGD
ncbi:transporter [Halolamina salina]|uniref:Transporter n=1 Tax=Halolamina salina TaxID=1220023 RepID=A0ABD6B382_9EURY